MLGGIVKTGAAPPCRRYSLPVAPRAILVHARGARGIRCARNSIFARPRHRNPETQNPPRKAGLHSPVARKLIDLAIKSFPETANFRKPQFLPRATCAPARPLPGGLRCNPGGSFALDFRCSS